MAMGGMGMRITTNAMIRRYSTNLNNALGDLDSKRNTVATNRNFNKIAEDPAAAMKSFKLRSNFQRTEVQKANTLDALAKLEEVTSNIQGCTSMGRNFIEKSLLSYSDPNSAFESRQAYKQEVDQLIESFLQQANGKYNENFIFGGASTKDLPFEKLESGEILYRGVPVNTPTYLTKDDISKILSETFNGLKDSVVATTPDLTNTLNTLMGNATFDSLASSPSLSDAYSNIMGQDYVDDDSKTISYAELTQKIAAFAPAGGVDMNGDPVAPPAAPLTDLLNKIMENPSGLPSYVKDQLSYDEVEAAIDAAVKSGDLTESQGYQLKANKEIGYQLKYTTYFNEHSYRDIGFGMKEKEGQIVSTSAFDTAVNGLDVFGHGIDEDGLPNNIIALAQELSKTLAVEDISDLDFEKHNKIINKMRASYNDMVDNGLAAIGTKCAFLENTDDQLTEASQILNEQISDLDFCDPAEAITNLMWAQYAYNATLKVGNTLLSNSFIDFMS